MNINLKIALGLFIFFLVFLLLYPVLTKDGPKSTVYVNDPIIDSLSYEISELKLKAEDLKDTIYAVRIDKGYTEIELNRAQGQVITLTEKYNKAKKLKDTVQLIVIADSFFNVVNESYIPLSEYVIKRANIIDSMQQIQISFKDSIISLHDDIRSKLTDDLYVERVNNQVLRDQAKKKNKQTIFAAIGGFVVGVIAVLSL